MRAHFGKTGMFLCLLPCDLPQFQPQRTAPRLAACKRGAWLEDRPLRDKRGEKKTCRVNFVPVRDMFAGRGKKKRGGVVRFGKPPTIVVTAAVRYSLRKEEKEKSPQCGWGQYPSRPFNRPTGYLLMPPYVFTCIPILRLTYGLIGPT